MTRIFVYGTLRKGDTRHHVLQDTIRVGDMWTVPGTLFSLGAFPALVLEDDNPVLGEVYEIPPEVEDRIMTTLDAIEGVSFGLYTRSEVQVSAQDDPEHTITCLTYTAGPRIDLEGRNRIVNGDWMSPVLE